MSTTSSCRRSGFDRSMLPDPLTYYTLELDEFDINGDWVKVRCPFHRDSQGTGPSLSVNIVGGYFKCHVCGAKGGDVLAFHMRRHGLGFKDAAQDLGAWS